MKVCIVTGCPSLTTGRYCSTHGRDSARNHHGVPRQRRGYGAAHDRAARQLRANPRPCELRLPGCTGIATSPEHRTPVSAGGAAIAPAGAACLHCQRAQGAALARPR